MKSLKTSAFVGALVAMLFVLPSRQAVAFDAQGLTDVLTFAPVSTLDVINWKVGDTMQYDVTVGAFGKLGTNTKSVTKDEGTAIWIRQEMKLAIQNQTVEMLLNKADGKVLKVIQDGREVQLPDDKIELISQDTATVKVPAGTFDTIHIVAKSQKISKIELWANPRDTAMDGGVKQAMTTQFGEIVMELTSFKRN